MKTRTKKQIEKWIAYGSVVIGFLALIWYLFAMWEMIA